MMIMGSGVFWIVRVEIVICGFYEFFLSEYVGYVGYYGFIYEDGTWYGVDVGELWCSEFYSWVVGYEVFSMGSVAGVLGFVDWFIDWKRLVEVLGLEDFIDDVCFGDYMVEVNDEGVFIYLVMFLVYDVNIDTCWMLDGNVFGISMVIVVDGDSLDGGYEKCCGGTEVWVRE